LEFGTSGVGATKIEEIAQEIVLGLEAVFCVVAVHLWSTEFVCQRLEKEKLKNLGKNVLVAMGLGFADLAEFQGRS